MRTRERVLDGVPLIDAVRFYSRHHGKGIKRKSVALAVDEMIERNTTKGVSKLYLDDLRYRQRWCPPLRARA